MNNVLRVLRENIYRFAHYCPLTAQPVVSKLFFKISTENNRIKNMLAKAVGNFGFIEHQQPPQIKNLT